MRFKKVYINDLNPSLDSKAVLEIVNPLVCDGQENKKPCILNFPGGGYAMCSNREADATCLKFLALGYITANLTYTCCNQKEGILYPLPQLEAIIAMNYLKEHAEELMIDETQISVIGYSAGGHLAGSFGYLYNDVELRKLANVSSENNLKPKSICLCYPVVTFGEVTHGGSRFNLCGDNSEFFDKLSIEKNVSKDYPPTMIWTTEDDQCVPYENSVLMVKSLETAGVLHKFKLHKHGVHGLATADELTCGIDSQDPEVAKWPYEFHEFNKSIK